MLEVYNFFANIITTLYEAMYSSWGIIGIGIIASLFLPKVVNIVKKMFN